MKAGILSEEKVLLLSLVNGKMKVKDKKETFPECDVASADSR
jgi:hypothetical protein